MKGVLNLVSVGPGFSDLIVPRAEAALRGSDVIVAYELYLRWIAPWIDGKEIHTPPLTKERERAVLAIEQARAGRKVSLISSGDIGIYAMAALAFDEMSEDDDYEVNVIPGVTSANACASLLGSPLSHDFATLSLSDLLCPWEWIEQRGRHIAEADLACVLYNVQSAGRKQGVYRILEIMLQSKSPNTLCGVIHNAYRPGQQVGIYSLSELPSMQFDMLTTIVIGNRYTKKKRGFIYTPRGYNSWEEPASPSPDERNNLPEQAVWVFSGTSDGNQLAKRLSEQGYPVVVSAATAYGGEVAAEHCPGVTVVSELRDDESRRQALSRHRARAIVDATHPYAQIISEQLMASAKDLGLPYLRYQRPAAFNEEDGIACDSAEQAAEQAACLGKRVFLATGSKDLAAFARSSECEWFVRLTPESEFIQRAIELGIPQSRICAMQGPFSEAFNEALWRDWAIDCVVTKDSGDAGGFQAKAAAAKALNIPLLVISRPRLDYPFVSGDFGEIIEQLNTINQ